MKYLKNNAPPQTITINQQRDIEYFSPSKNGKFTKNRIKIAMHRTMRDIVETDEIDQFVKKYNLPSSEKVIISYKNDRYTSEQRRPLNYSFTVLHHPHITFIVGNDKTDEITYIFPVGEIVKVEDDNHAQLAVEMHGSLDEVDEKGTIIWENRWKTDMEEAQSRKRVDMSTYPKHFERVDMADMPGRKTPIDKRVTKLVENEDVG